MNKILLALASLTILTASSLWANEAKESKKCADDKDATCICKDAKDCDAAAKEKDCAAAKDKGCCAKPKTKPEKKN